MLRFVVMQVVLGYETLAVPLECNVLIAGGSAAALSASITAAITNTTLSICLTEPTLTLGGQLDYYPTLVHSRTLLGYHASTIISRVLPAGRYQLLLVHLTFQPKKNVLLFN